MAIKKILVIDDNEALCNAIQLGLEDMGQFAVRIVTNPSQAKSVVADFNPDLIILDVVMPQKSGMEVEFDLNESSNTTRIPIIYMTALASKCIEDRGNDQLKRQVVLSKPISMDQLIEVINKMLQVN